MALIINPNAKSGSDFNQMFPHLSAKDFDDYIYNHNSNPDYGRSAYFWTDGKDVFMETFLGDTNQIQECCHEYMRCHNDPIVTMLLEMEQQKNVHDEYIHSDEFIRQFGNWEKINRIEKLKKSKPLSIDGTIIINGEDVTDTINELRENPSKKNIKLLNNYVVALGKEMIHDIRLENNLSPYENPKFHINDDGKTYNFSFAGIKEASRHNLYQPGHIEGIYNIPEIIRSSIYIGTENNDDHRKPELKKFYYYALGIKLNNVDYTAKIVFTEKYNGDIYYDQSLSDIEKGKFVDLIKKEPDAVNRINRPDSIGLSAESVHPHKKGQNSHSPYYDKRLFRICQVPQLPYLERNPLTNLWHPTEEAIELVRNHQLYIQKDGQIYNMVDKRQSIGIPIKQNKETDKGLIIDAGVESIDANGGMSEAAIEADIKAQEQENLDYNDDEEGFDDIGQIPLEVLDRRESDTSINGKSIEYTVRIEDSRFVDMVPFPYSELLDNEIPCINYTKPVEPGNPDSFTAAVYRNNDYSSPSFEALIEIDDKELVRQIKNVADNYEAQHQEFLEIRRENSVSGEMSRRLENGEIFATYDDIEKERTESAVNQRLSETVKSQFDKELSDYTDGKLPENHVFNLGIPGEILQKCGFPKDQRIELSGSRLKFKSNLTSHPFELKDIFGLDKALQTPIAVFSYGNRNKSQNVIVDLDRDGKHFLAGIHFNQKKRGYEISDMRTLFPKDNIEWLNWINQGKMIYGNKEKLQALIAQQRINVAEVNSQVVQSPLNEHCLESANSILEKFCDVKDIFTDGHAFYDEIRKQSAIEQKFFGYYTEKSNLDARELAQFEAQEFYHALKSGDVEKIREYTEHEELHEISDVAKKIYESQFCPQAQENSNNPLTDYTKIEVNGKERECKNGVLEGFKNAVRQLDSVIDTNHELCDENNRLVIENMRLKEQLNKRNHNKEHERG